jgi:hypothetical protein
MMAKPTLQRVLQQHLPSYTESHRLDGQRLKVCRHLLSCHTPVLGGLQWQCDQCGHRPVSYHSCRDRHCPQCQARDARRWCELQQAALLPVTYYHLVFTLPHDLNGWVQLHPRVIYNLLFRVVWRTLKTFGADPKRLNGRLGMTAVLHTWGRNLGRHVHLHCLVPGGALTKQDEWQAAKSNYLFPVKALSRHFRGAMVSALRQAQQAGRLKRVKPEMVDPTLDALMCQDWVVYSKPCLAQTEQIIGYLARYTHRIAISDQRLLAMDERGITFAYRDTRTQQPARLTLAPGEFIRRFLMHVLPGGFMRIRHYGWLANRCREKALKTIRKCLGSVEAEATVEDESAEPAVWPCPKCRKGKLSIIEQLSPQPMIHWQPG